MHSTAQLTTQQTQVKGHEGATVTGTSPSLLLWSALFADLLHNESNVAAGILRFDKCCVKFGSAATKQTHTPSLTLTHTLTAEPRTTLSTANGLTHTQTASGKISHGRTFCRCNNYKSSSSSSSRSGHMTGSRKREGPGLVLRYGHACSMPHMAHV